MVIQTHLMLLHHPPTAGFLSFVFFSTVCSYNFHWFLTPDSVDPSQRNQWTQQRKGLHLLLYFIGLLGCIISFFTIREHWVALGFAAFVTFLYSAPKLPQQVFRSLKEVAVGKTIFLAFVWMYVTTALPVLVSGESWRTEHFLFCASRFFQIYAICILFDYRDRENDLKEGIRSMVTLFNEKGIDLLFGASTVLFILATLGLLFYGHALSVIIPILIPGLITVALYRYSKTHFSDYLYYFVLDGLMALSGLFMLFIRI
jgi:4-hydroxybenzoate polyprenyltransferase